MTYKKVSQRTYNVVVMISRIGALTRSGLLIKTWAIITYCPQRIVLDTFGFVSEVAVLEKLLDFFENVGGDF
jgi:hypothetical protein